MAKAAKYVSPTGHPLVHLHYSSICEMRGLVAGPWAMDHNRISAEGYLTNEADRPHWYGIAGGAPAVMSALEHGYPDGESRVDAMRQHMLDKLPVAVGIGRKLVRGMSGDDLDIHAVNRGDIGLAWSSRKRQIKRGNTSLRLCVDIGGNAGSDANAMQWRGVAAICLGEVMSKAGYNVELVACFAARGLAQSGSRRDCIISCVVKPTSTSADRGLLAASVALTGFFRTVGFAAICKAADDHGVKVDSGLGQHLQCEGILPASDKVTQVMVPSTIGSEQEAQAWIKQTVGLLQSIKGTM